MRHESHVRGCDVAGNTAADDALEPSIMPRASGSAKRSMHLHLRMRVSGPQRKVCPWLRTILRCRLASALAVYVVHVVGERRRMWWDERRRSARHHFRCSKTAMWWAWAGGTCRPALAYLRVSCTRL